MLSHRFGTSCYARFLSALLTIALSLGPAPAYALRPSQEGAALEELKQQFNSEPTSAVGLEEREKQLAVLKEQVEAKQAELDALFRTMPPGSGEFRDRERAVARIGRLIRTAEELDVAGFSELFDQYFAKVATPLLRQGPDRLNKILASGRVRVSFDRLHNYLHESLGMYFITHGVSSLISKVIQGEASGWAGIKEAFYLDGFPIVVEPENLSAEGRARLEMAAHRIIQSGWTLADPHALIYLESIRMREIADHSASMIGKVRPFAGNQIRFEGAFARISPYVIASYLLHEDRHLRDRNTSEFSRIDEFERLNDVPDVKHPWFATHRGPPSVLLMELSAHAVDARFLLHIRRVWRDHPDLSFADSDTMRLQSGVVYLAHARGLARRAITLLKRRAAQKHLHQAAEAWLHTLTRQWDQLGPQINTFVDQTLSEFLDTEDLERRWLGYQGVGWLWQDDPPRRKTYLKRFEKSIRQEESPKIWLGLLSQRMTWLPAPLRGAISDEIARRGVEGQLFIALLGLGQRPESGLEEPTTTTLNLFAKSVQGRKGVVVLEQGVLEQRAGLEELVKRLPPGLAERVVVFRGGLEEAIPDLAARLLTIPEADHVTYVGLEEEQARRLQQLLPASMVVTYQPPTVGLVQIFLALGVPREVVEQALPAGLEEALALGRAA